MRHPLGEGQTLWSPLWAIVVRRPLGEGQTLWSPLWAIVVRRPLGEGQTRGSPPTLAGQVTQVTGHFVL